MGFDGIDVCYEDFHRQWVTLEDSLLQGDGRSKPRLGGNTGKQVSVKMFNQIDKLAWSVVVFESEGDQLVVDAAKEFTRSLPLPLPLSLPL